MKKVVIIQARMGASRFPGKVLASLKDKPVLEWVVDAAITIPTIDQVVVATSDLPIDQSIVRWCQQKGISSFQGNESDVLSRFYAAAQKYGADIIVRVTADCPLLDAHVAGQVLSLVSRSHADYACNIMPATWPDGLDCEAFTFQALQEANAKATRLSDREHVTPYIRNNQFKFKVINVPAAMAGLQNHRWTVDTQEDLAFLEKLLTPFKKRPTTIELLEALDNNPNLVQPTHTRNEGFEKSLQLESTHYKHFENSKALLKRALKTIPVGSQTFSKSYLQYPKNSSPLFLTHGQGARVWDVDGNEYIDLVSGLLCNILGYNDPDVNSAIQAQLQKGISFSLATELEAQLAEKLCSLIPSAEKVRFAKNGTDVTSAAIRLSRAYTGRDQIILCGYHGWQDWSIGTTTRNKGVPKTVSDLSVAVQYNDLNRVESLLKTEHFAALIMEPCTIKSPNPGYLQGLKDLCEQYGSVFIFDEIVTGFRFALGGAQEYFGVTPHLSCFGKAMGNGMPIAAIVGRSDIMQQMEEIFFSGTFGGETLSIAAALATIRKIEVNNIIETLWNLGDTLSREITRIITDLNLRDIVKLGGYAPWTTLLFCDPKPSNIDQYVLKTLFQQEMIKTGVLILGSNNLCYAHGNSELEKIQKAYARAFETIRNVCHTGNINDFIHNPIIRPLFKVR